MQLNLTIKLVWWIAYQDLGALAPKEGASALVMCEWQKNMHKSERDLYLVTAGLGTQALLYSLIYYKHKVDRLQRFKQREEEALHHAKNK